MRAREPRMPTSGIAVAGALLALLIGAAGPVRGSLATGPVSGASHAAAAAELPRHALIGYVHASFANGSGYLPLAEVPDAWDIIDLAFAEPTSQTSGDIRFDRCPAGECPNVESEADFTAAIRARQAQGKKVLISIGGQNGQVRLTTTAARDAFVRSVGAIIDRYGLDGLDIDFEGHSLSLDPGDTDFQNPTTPVIVNLIWALRELKQRHGAGFVLTMAPETFFVQLGYQFYGPGANGTATRGPARTCRLSTRCATTSQCCTSRTTTPGRSWGSTTSSTSWAAPTSTSR
jgi:chitinase